MRRLLDYLPPKGAELPFFVGCRVQVPLGNRRVVAVITAIIPRSESDIEHLKHAENLLDASPLISDTQLELLRWTAHYYQHPPGETMILGLSPRE
ncbi:MAG: primosomal protein N', partial [Cellvibrionales bacterium]|nr:primosomal protein N' [Cellvibrionales bacterium]